MKAHDMNDELGTLLARRLIILSRSDYRNLAGSGGRETIVTDQTSPEVKGTVKNDCEVTYDSS